ncbi:MAG: hypothetical protein ACK55Z_32695, partial [bacterium]
YLRERKRGQRDRERKRGRRQGSGRGAGEERDWGGGEESFFDNQEGRGERGPKDTLTHTKNPPPHHLIHFKGSSEAITSNDWTAFFNFCQYPRGPFYRLLHPVFTEAGATLCSYKRAGKIVSCHNSISSLALLNNDDYMILLKDAWSESPGDKLTCDDVTP